MRTSLLILSFFLFCIHSFGQKKKLKEKPVGIQANFEPLDGYEIGLGLISVHDTIPIKIAFKNTGTDSLHIKRVKTSCSCIKITYPDTAIAPNMQGHIEVVYIPKKDINRGYVTLRIHYNSMNSPALMGIFSKIWYGE